MVFTILLCYVCGLGIERSRNRKKLWLLASIVISVGLLGVFKYADFFIGSLNAVTGLKIPLLHLALPVGISFYTFQCLSYTIDVYRGSVPAQKSFINFGAYVALFPQLIAGPSSAMRTSPGSWNTGSTAGTTRRRDCGGFWWGWGRRSFSRTILPC